MPDLKYLDQAYGMIIVLFSRWKLPPWSVPRTVKPLKEASIIFSTWAFATSITSQQSNLQKIPTFSQHNAFTGVGRPPNVRRGLEKPKTVGLTIRPTKRADQTIRQATLRLQPSLHEAHLRSTSHGLKGRICSIVVEVRLRPLLMFPTVRSKNGCRGELQRLHEDIESTTIGSGALRTVTAVSPLSCELYEAAKEVRRCWKKWTGHSMWGCHRFFTL